MKKNLLIRANLLGCDIRQNSLHKWIIRGLTREEVWSIEEKGANTWIVTSEGIPQMSIETETALKILDRLVKK